MKHPWMVVLAPCLLAAASATPAVSQQRTLEFEVASVKSVPAAGFHFSSASDVGTGGPGTADPGMFRCANCTLAALISKAFQLRDYQFPARSSLMNDTFAVAARVPPDTTKDEFLVMLQALLKERFALTFHFENKTVRGYRLIVAKGGAKLRESNPTSASTRALAPRQSGAADRGYGQGSSHEHSGAVNFNGQARYQVMDRSISDLVQVLSDELTRPIDDQTGLTGRYDISLSWSSDSGAHAVAAGGFGGDHNHSGAPGGAPGTTDERSGPALLDALQSQLGLKLVDAERATVRIFIVDRVNKVPLPN